MNQELGIKGNGNVRVRIAPSPTGHLHVGTARSALFNFLFAKHHGGTFLLRIEDTDKERSKKEYEKGIIESLEWLGLKWDEEVVRQSERGNLYRSALKKLIDDGEAFYCRHPQKEEGIAVHHCDERLREPIPGSIIRFAGPSEKDEVIFNDLIRGLIRFSGREIGDFSIAKGLDTPLYNFAAAIDDHAMNISHVIRGEDHIANTPKQILLRNALGYPHPEYAHLPLLLGTDRSKLSKRHGATSIVEFRDQGYLPEALANFLALLGWNPGGDQEIFSFEELISKFSLESVNKSGAVFDIQKLDWMNGEYIRMMSVEDLTNRLQPFLEKAGISIDDVPRQKREAIIAVEQSRLRRLSEIGDRIKFYFVMPEVSIELLRWKAMERESLIASLSESKHIISQLQEYSSEEEIEKKLFEAAHKFPDRGELLWPLRAALTGLRASPSPFEIIAILGKEETLRRIDAATEILRS